MARAALTLLALTLLWPPAHAEARQVEREVQVALDPDRGVFELDARLRGRLRLFPEVAAFEVARLFRTPAGEHVLEIAYREGGVPARERRRLTFAELEAFRADLGGRLAEIGQVRVLDREGRPGFVVGQTAVGLFYHGWVVPVALDIDSDRGIVAAYLLTSGASFLVPWMVTARADMGVAQRDAAFWGATRGILYGVTFGGVVAPERTPQRPFFEEDEGRRRARLALGSAGSVLGSFLGYELASRLRPTPGTVALWSAAGDFGLAGGFGTAYALGLFRGEEVCDDFGFCWRDDFQLRTAGSAVTLALGLASLVGAQRWGEAVSYSVGDARALRSFGLLGAQALLPAAVELFTEEDEDGGDRAVAAAAVLGGAAGLFLGDRALRDVSLTGGEGLLVLAGHVAGGLSAVGLTYLLDPGEPRSATLYLATAAAGSALGSLLTFRAVRGGPPAGVGAGPSGRRGGAGRGVDVTLHPEGALVPLLFPRWTASEGVAAPVPLVRVRF